MDETQANTPDTPNDEPNTPRKSSSGALVVFLLVAVIGLAVFKLVIAPSGQQAVNEKLPALELVPLTGAGQPVTLDQLKGKIALINFWATWCPPCRDELPHIADLYKHFATNDDFVLLAVSSGGEDLNTLRRKTEALLANEGLELPTYVDPNGATQNAFQQAAQWGGGIPATFLLDRSGMIRQKWIGFGPGQEESMRAAVEELLKE